MEHKVNGLTLSEAILNEMKTAEGIGNLLNLGGSEEEHPQVKALKQFISTAKEPWDKNLYKWRLSRVEDALSVAGLPGGGMGPPVDAKGNPIPVLPNREWLKKNPSIIKEIPNDCLPPEMQQPGMIDKFKQTLGIQEDKEDPKEKYKSLLDKKSKAITSDEKSSIDKELEKLGKKLSSSQDWEAQDLVKNNPPLEPSKPSAGGASNSGLTGVWSVPDKIELNENADLDRIKLLAKKLLG